MAANSRSRLGEMLLAEGVVTPEQLEAALELSAEIGVFVGQAMVELEYLDEEQLVTFLVRQCRIPHINLTDYDIDREIAELIPSDICRLHSVIPVDRLGNMLTVAMVDPLDDEAMEAVAEHCDLNVKPILCSWYDFEQVSRRMFGDATMPPPRREPSDEASLSEPQAEPVSAASLQERVRETPEEPSDESPALSDALDANGSPEERRKAVKAALLAKGERRAEPASKKRAAVQPSHKQKRGAKSASKPLSKTGASPSAVTDAVATQFTFDSFVSSETNEFAYSLAKAVAESPGGEANPFFLYGDVGLGKTHLLVSIINDITAQHKDLHMTFLSSSEFGQLLVDAVDSGNLKEFRSKYATCDVLILDDVQFLVGRARAQEEFFAIFNHLLEHGRQIVLAADKHPEELNRIERRLISRFVGGIVAGLEPPDWDTRIEILCDRMKQTDSTIPMDVLELIATSFPDDVRKLIGALRKIVAYCTLVKRDITVDVAQEILSHLYHTPFA